MNSLLMFLIGLTSGVYFAEPIRETIPLLDPNKTVEPEEGV